jgi:hypothetical protein
MQDQWDNRLNCKPITYTMVVVVMVVVVIVVVVMVAVVVVVTVAEEMSVGIIQNVTRHYLIQVEVLIYKPTFLPTAPVSKKSVQVAGKSL